MGLGYLAKCGVVSGKLFVTYMYFVYTYVYDCDDWLSYLGCGLLIYPICDCCAKFGVCRVCG